MNNHYWVIDFEGFHLDNSFIVNKISFLSKDQKTCVTYFTKTPHHCLAHPPYSQTYYFQLRYHRISWYFGRIAFKEAMNDIIDEIENDVVYCKGLEKCQFLQAYIANVKEITEDMIAIPFELLTGSNDKVCI